METLTFTIDIRAPKKHVWDTMLSKETYHKWIKGFSENSTFIGEWKEGTSIIFYDPNMGGTKANMEEIVPYEKIYAVHTGLVDKNAKEEINEYSECWIGSSETYLFREENEVTTLEITIKTHSNFVDMMKEGWSKALPILKELCEIK